MPMNSTNHFGKTCSRARAPCSERLQNRQHLVMANCTSTICVRTDHLGVAMSWLEITSKQAEYNHGFKCFAQACFPRLHTRASRASVS
jgi:hypothetical protein